MNVNVLIKENGQSKALSVKKLKTAKQGGGELPVGTGKRNPAYHQERHPNGVYMAEEDGEQLEQLCKLHAGGSGVVSSSFRQV